ncbi:snakin-2-like [Rhododendron vialii]|uniref:snakin-2-like n=1 Tax=Rhododendron vialii TaxID=182163 RepID=UPI00265DB1EC|nr:snakin-2-like [Rhododendron vialii]
MAITKALVASLVLSLLVLDLVQPLQTNQVTSNSLTDTTVGEPLDCGGACAGRCKLSSRPNLCKRACGTCCARCQCVPPGTSGNLEACPCYATMTTHNNRRKCP